MNSRLFVTLALFFMGIQAILHAQDSCKVVILGPRVGAIIDKTERDRYKLFQQFPAFESGIVLKGHASSYGVRIEYRDTDGRIRDSILVYSEQALLMVAEKINHFEDLEDGNYRIGTDPSRLQFADTVVAVPLPTDRVSSPGPAPNSPAETGHDVSQTNPRSLSMVPLSDQPWEIRSLSGDTVSACALDSLHGMALFATCGGKTFSFPVDSIAVLVREKESHFKEGASIGWRIGAAAGALIFALTVHPPAKEGLSNVDVGASIAPLGIALAGCGVGALTGYLCGGLIGSLSGGRETYELKEETLGAKLRTIEQVVKRTE
jgi:hypothetical protein